MNLWLSWFSFYYTLFFRISNLCNKVCLNPRNTWAGLWSSISSNDTWHLIPHEIWEMNIETTDKERESQKKTRWGRKVLCIIRCCLTIPAILHKSQDFWSNLQILYSFFFKSLDSWTSEVGRSGRVAIVYTSWSSPVQVGPVGTFLDKCPNINMVLCYCTSQFKAFFQIIFS